MTCSSILAGGTTGCKLMQITVYDSRIISSLLSGCFWLHVSMYLIPGSSLLCTHWDSHSKHWKMNVGMFLRSDRLDYSLQYKTDVYTVVIKSSEQCTTHLTCV